MIGKKTNTMQTKKHSLIESVTNTLIGLLISFTIQIFLYKMLGIPVTIGQNVLITLVFTGVSILRNYIIRRLFNKATVKNSSRKHAE